MSSKGQGTLEMLIVFGILVLGVIIFGTFYINSHNKQTDIKKLDEEIGNVKESLVLSKEINPSSITCGNTLCEPGETCSNCSSDCGACSVPPEPPPPEPSCGDGTCNNGETCADCPRDCGACYCLELLNPIQFSPEESLFSGISEISLKYSDPNCEDFKIRFEFGEKIPDKESNLFTEPIIIKEPTIINAKVFATSSSGNAVESEVFTKFYTLDSQPCYFEKSIGSGTEKDPKIICNVGELNDVRNNSGLYHLLGTNLDLSPELLEKEGWYNKALGWEPIGNLSKPFVGHFYGNNNKISNLTIIRDKEDYIGLFGYLGENVEIKDLILENANIIGGNTTGALFGESFNKEVIIKNISVTGMIIGNSYVGGIAGKLNPNTVVSFCKINALVSGNSYVGGLAGYSENSNISESYSQGEIKSFEKTAFTGGLVGFLYLGELIKSYSVASVIGGSDVGGLVGGNDKGDVSFCYSVGQVTGNKNVGGLVGSVVPEVKDTSNYWDFDTSIQTESAMGLGYRTSEMFVQKTYIDWDFDTIWAIEEGKSYPDLINNPQK